MEKKIDAIVDITNKKDTVRMATASGILRLNEKSIGAIRDKSVKKGDVIEASTVAAIQAVKETPRIIPHCHPIPLQACDVNWNIENELLRCTVTVKATYKTGIEMEAITGVCAGLLCALDMVKSFEKDEQGLYPETSIDEVKIIDKVK